MLTLKNFYKPDTKICSHFLHPRKIPVLCGGGKAANLKKGQFLTYVGWDFLHKPGSHTSCVNMPESKCVSFWHRMCEFLTQDVWVLTQNVWDFDTRWVRELPYNTQPHNHHKEGGEGSGHLRLEGEDWHLHLGKVRGSNCVQLSMINVNTMEPRCLRVVFWGLWRARTWFDPGWDTFLC